MELSGEIPVKLLCKTMGIQRSSFYAWKKTSFSAVGQRKAPFEQRPAVPGVPLEVSIARLSLAERQDTVGQRDCPVRSLMPTKCCRIAGIKSKSKHYRYKKAGDPARIFPNLLMSEMQIDGPMQCIVSDMTAFLCERHLP